MRTTLSECSRAVATLLKLIVVAEAAVEEAVAVAAAEVEAGLVVVEVEEMAEVGDVVLEAGLLSTHVIQARVTLMSSTKLSQLMKGDKSMKPVKPVLAHQVLDLQQERWQLSLWLTQPRQCLVHPQSLRCHQRQWESPGARVVSRREPLVPPPRAETARSLACTVGGLDPLSHTTT